MDTTISATIAIVAALSIAAVVSAISFSTPVHAQATHFQGGTCTGPDKSCTKGVIASNSPSTLTANLNLLSQSHGTGFTPQGPGQQ